MRAAVCEGPRRLSVRDLPVGPPGADEVLVRVEWCGVCGTDLHLVLDGWGRPGSVGGHEWSGVVLEVGPDVTGWSPGDRVAGGPGTCGTCAHCAAGRPSLCVADSVRTGASGQGAFAELRLVPQRALHHVPDGLDLRVAALAEPLAVSLHALTRSGLRRAGAPGALPPRDRRRTRVLVTGAGPIGLLLVAAVLDAGVTDLTVSEPTPARRERVAAVGAPTVLSPQQLPPAPVLPMQVTDEPFDVVFECSGNLTAAAHGLGLLAPGGTFVAVGAGLGDLAVPATRILLNELVVTGSYNYDADGLDDALALLATGRLPVDLLVEPVDVPLSGMLDAFEALAAGRTAGKVLVRPSLRDDEGMAG